MAGGGVLVVGEEMGGCGLVYFGCLGGGGTKMRGKGLYGWLGKMGERGGENDLKAGHEGPKTEYVRTYIGTFDRTHAGCMSVWVNHAFELM
jgi:hypothetical protein